VFDSKSFPFFGAMVSSLLLFWVGFFVFVCSDVIVQIHFLNLCCLDFEYLLQVPVQLDSSES